MTEFVNNQDHTALSVDHDAHGCTVLMINPNDDKTNPVVYGIPSEQVPAVLFDMAGGDATEQEHQEALDFLNDPAVAPASMDEFIAMVRKTLLALHIRTQMEVANLAAAAEADAPNYDLVDADIVDEYDDMSRTELLTEAKALRTAHHQTLQDQDKANQELWTANQRFEDLVGGIGNIADALADLTRRMRGNADA